MKIIVFISTIFLLQGLALAADKDISSAPLFYLQGSLGNNSALAMRCVGEAPFREIDCSFTQVSITAVPIERTAKNKKDVAADMAKVTQKDIDKFKKGIDLTKFLQNMKTASPEQKAFMQDFLNIQTEMQKVKDRSSLAKVMGDFQDFEGATCRISQRTFDHHFTRVSKNKWLYNPGPDGLCNVVRIATLENRPDYPELWTYSETVVTADQDKTCKKWVEVGVTYTSSWDAPKGLKFDTCKYLEFGF